MLPICMPFLLVTIANISSVLLFMIFSQKASRSSRVTRAIPVSINRVTSLSLSHARYLLSIYFCKGAEDRFFYLPRHLLAISFIHQYVCLSFRHSVSCPTECLLRDNIIFFISAIICFLAFVSFKNFSVPNLMTLWPRPLPKNRDSSQHLPSLNRPRSQPDNADFVLLKNGDIYFCIPVFDF